MSEVQKDAHSQSKTYNYYKSINDVWLQKFEELSKSYKGERLFDIVKKMLVANPDVRNNILKNIKTMPYLPDRNILEKALENPLNNERLLRSIGSNLFYNSYPLYKAIRFYDGALLYKYYVSPVNVKPEYMQKERFQKEKAFVNKYIEKLNPKYTFRRIVQEVLQTGKRAYYLVEEWEDGKKIIVNSQEKEDKYFAYDNANRKIKSVFLRDLPDDYIKLIGKSTDSYYTIAFDFSYFLINGINPDDFPDIFKDYLAILKSARIERTEKSKKNNKKERIEFNQEILRQKNLVVDYGYSSDKGFYCWVEMPSDVCQVFSADESTPLQAPNFLGIFLMSIDLQAYNLLQQQLTGIPLYSMIIGTVPINEEDDENPLVLPPGIVEYYTSMINSLLPDGTTYVMTPTKDNKAITFNELPNSTKVYGAALQGMISTMGMAGVLSTTDKPSLAQVKTSQIMEVRFADVLYDQFESFVNRRLEKLTDLNYLRYDWKFRIFGDVFTYKERVDMLFKGLGQGIVSLLPEYLAYFDLTLEDAVQIAEMVKASGIYDKFMPLVSSYNQKFDDKRGRPEKDDSEIDNENTEKSKDSGRNTIEGRVVSTMRMMLEDLLEEQKEKLLDRIIEMQEERES